MSASEIASDELIELVSRFLVVEPEALWQYLAGRGGAASFPADGATLAQELVRDGILTPFQANCLCNDRGDTLAVGKYRILAKLGRPSSSVFLCERRPGGLGKLAIKVLPQNERTARVDIERFRREAEAMARLDHPGIVNIKEVGEDNGRLFLVMEHVEGKSLTELVAEQGPLAPVPATRIVHDACLALAHVHEAGLVHRNLHPDHIIQDTQGRVRLVDLGLVRFLDDPGNNLTMIHQPGAVLGSIEYLAPEQVLNSHSVDICADIYALGAIFYFLLAGRAPFSHQGVLRLAAGVVTYPQPLAQLRPDVPLPVLDVIARMMSLDLAGRYHTPGEPAAELQSWLADVAPAPLQTPRRPSTRVNLETKPDFADLLPSEPTLTTGPSEEEGSGWSVLGWMWALAMLVFLGFLAVLLWQR